MFGGLGNSDLQACSFTGGEIRFVKLGGGGGALLLVKGGSKTNPEVLSDQQFSCGRSKSSWLTAISSVGVSADVKAARAEGRWSASEDAKILPRRSPPSPSSWGDGEPCLASQTLVAGSISESRQSCRTPSCMGRRTTCRLVFAVSLSTVAGFTWGAKAASVIPRRTQIIRVVDSRRSVSVIAAT